MSHDGVVRSDGVGGWGLIIVVAVVAALFSMLSQPPKNVAPTPPAAPSPSAAAAPSAIAQPALPTDAAPISLSPTQAALQLHAGYVSAPSVCPVSTDHRTTLSITLVLRNDTQVTERVEGLAPALPLGGLVDQGVVIRSGSCQVPFGKPVKADGQVLPAGTTILVTLHLGLPRTCPQPLPVGLDVTLSISGDVRAESLSLFDDLGSIPFATCPAG